MSSSAGENGVRVLVVEDESHLAIGIKYNLEAEGYEAIVAPDGPTALREFEEAQRAEKPFDLVVLDLMLPGMSGYAVCEALRSEHAVPILILSARTLVEDRIRGYDLGADHFLQKPFDLEELLSIARNLLQRHRNGIWDASRGSSDCIEFGAARINFETFEASFKDEPRKLTATQMKLLRYLVEAEGRVVTRNELLKHVWGMEHHPSTRTVDNFILDLRKSFEEDPSQPQHFLSVRGIGYRFVAEANQD